MHSQHAGRVIYNSYDTRLVAEPFLKEHGRVPPGVVAHLGVTRLEPVATDIPNVLPDQPYFVTIGTIEPRKNHAFLLDLWDSMGPTAPGLLLCGSRGWQNTAVFEWLECLPKGGPIRELAGLSDGALAALMSHSAGVLMPSLAEGYGLPVLEAEALGARVLCNSLPVFRELRTKNVVIHPVSASESWSQTIRTWADTPDQGDRKPNTQVPTWADHFNTVLR